MGIPSTSCLVIHINWPKHNELGRIPDACLEEAAGLALAVGLEISAKRIVALRKPSPKTLIGKGTVTELSAEIRQHLNETQKFLVIINSNLNPVQQQNLERTWNCKVIDRTGLILEIFAARAKTREGILQVQLASLTYERSRLVRSWTHLERQRGGLQFIGGPGETQIESDRRLLSARIRKIEKKIKGISRTRKLHRSSRKNIPSLIVALVGYTNAGKSTLFNKLTGASVSSSNQLFATLDPTMRKLKVPSKQSVILSDTVGFLSDLPHELINAFHATLEEVKEADIILHIRDSAHPNSDAQYNDVLRVLKELRVEKKPTIEIFNKIDLLEDKMILFNRVKRSDRATLAISAKTGEGCENILKMISKQFVCNETKFIYDIPITNGAAVAWLYDRGAVSGYKNKRYSIQLTVNWDEVDAAQFEKKFGNFEAKLTH